MSQTITIIRAAVEPLRADAIARAEQRVRDWVARVEAQLAAVNNDMRAYAPFPSSAGSDYKRKLAFRKAVESVVTYAAAYARGGEPQIVSVNAEKVERFVRDARDEASASFDAYAEKLAGKVGTIRSASICGATLWHGSTLTVETEAGEVQRWRTTQIVNVSVLGKLFNQWPTRRLK